MTTATPAPRRTASGPPTTQKRSLSEIIATGNGLPNRYILYAGEKWGKTSFAAQTPKPIFIQSRGETGLEPLIDAGRIKETPHFPESQEWTELLGCVRALIDEEHEYKTLVIDTLNGAERLCHEFICSRDFGGDWGDKGFGSYQKGPEVALAEWRTLLGDLDTLRRKKHMTVFILCHTKIAAYRNPVGADYDRFQPDMDKRTWALTAKWADVILFGAFDETVGAVKENKKTGEQKGKGLGGNARIMYTEKTAAFDAGNRLGLPAEIEMGSSAAEAWKSFTEALKAGKAVQQ